MRRHLQGRLDLKTGLIAGAGITGIGRRTLLCGVMFLVADGCAMQSNVPVAKSMQLQIGMSRDQVLALKSNPRAIETYGGVEFWLYPADMAEDQTRAFFPVGFVNARVTGWGSSYYDDAISGKTSPDGSVTARQ